MNDPLSPPLPEALSSSSSVAVKDHPAGFVPLRRAAVVLTWGLPALGLVQAAKLLALMLRTPSQGLLSWAGCLLEMISTIVAYALAGIGIGALFRSLEQWMLVSLIGQHAPDQERLVNLEKRPDPLTAQPRGQEGPELSPEPVEGPSQPAADWHHVEAVAETRQAIWSAKWDVADAHLAAFSSDHGDDPRLAALQDELQTARSKARDEHLAQLDAARKVGDPERVLELHQNLVPLLDAEARTKLDADLSRWFLRLIHNRLRGGKIQADLAHLAGRIAESFSHTVEGASLRASLPTLRRSANLCPRCARPYTGLGDACPVCLGQGDRTRRPAEPDDGSVEPE
jgi:hypothetical protein